MQARLLRSSVAQDNISPHRSGLRLRSRNRSRTRGSPMAYLMGSPIASGKAYPMDSAAQPVVTKELLDEIDTRQTVDHSVHPWQVILVTEGHRGVIEEPVAYPEQAVGAKYPRLSPAGRGLQFEERSFELRRFEAREPFEDFRVEGEDAQGVVGGPETRGEQNQLGVGAEALEVEILEERFVQRPPGPAWVLAHVPITRPQPPPSARRVDGPDRPARRPRQASGASQCGNRGGRRAGQTGEPCWPARSR